MTAPQPAPADKILADRLDLVYAAALRQMNHDAQSAADVTQAVFLVALKKARAGRLPEDRHMTGWLLKITAYAAKEFRRAARRREIHETRAAAPPDSLAPASFAPADPTHSAHAAEITALLDQSLLHLGQLDREVLARRYLRGESLPTVALAIGANENTAGRRIARALEKLRKLLARRGVTAPAATLAAVLLAESTLKAPAALAANLPAASAATTLAKLILWRLTMAKAATALLVTAGILFLGTGAYIAVLFSNTAAANPPTPSPIASTATSAPTTQMLQVTAVTEENSEKLLKEVLAGIEDNRKKLKTLEVVGTYVNEAWDAKKNAWTETERQEGKMSVETTKPWRARAEIFLDKTVWHDGAAPFYTESYTEVWDGNKTKRLFEPPYSRPRGEIRDEWMLLSSEHVLGGGFSLQMMHANIMRDGKIQPQDELDSEYIKLFQLSARRVVLNRNQPAVELRIAILKGSIRFWFDSNRGYGLLGYSEGTDAEPHYHEKTVDEMVEAAPGVFYPTKGREIWMNRGAPRKRVTFSASKVVANKPFAPGIFDLKFPDGIRVTEQPASRPTTQR